MIIEKPPFERIVTCNTGRCLGGCGNEVLAFSAIVVVFEREGWHDLRAMKFINQKTASSMPKHGVRIENHAHEPGFQTESHEHEYHSLLYVVSGQGQIVMGDECFELMPNTAVVLKAHKAHQLIDSPCKAMTIFVVYFDQPHAGIDDKILLPLFDLGKPISVPPYNAQRLRRLLRQMLHEQEAESLLFEEAMRQCLGAILLDLHRIVNEEDEARTMTQCSSEQRLSAVLRVVARNLYETYTLAGVAKMAGLSQRQFTNLCRKHTGRSFSQYVNLLRTKRAVDLLRNTNMPVAAIAFDVGYEDLSTFYRAFKRFFKTSPMALRNAPLTEHE